LFILKAPKFVNDLKQASHDTYNEILKDCIVKESKLHTFIEVIYIFSNSIVKAANPKQSSSSKEKEKCEERTNNGYF
jgi:hypothetical protein